MYVELETTSTLCTPTLSSFVSPCGLGKGERKFIFNLVIARRYQLVTRINITTPASGRGVITESFLKNQFADLFVTGKPIICIPSFWSIFAPVLYIFYWAFTSRSCQVPHFGHIHFLTPKSLTSVLYPQHPQVCEDGYHLLIFLKYLPARSILYR